MANNGKKKKPLEGSDESARQRRREIARKLGDLGDTSAPPGWVPPEDRPEPINFQATADKWAKKPYWDCVNEGAALLLGQEPKGSDVDVEVWFYEDRELHARFLDLRDTLRRHILARNIEPKPSPAEFLRFAETENLGRPPEELTTAVEDAPVVSHNKGQTKSGTSGGDGAGDDGAALTVPPSEAIRQLREEDIAPGQLMFAEACESLWGNKWPPSGMGLSEIHGQCCTWLDQNRGVNKSGTADHISTKIIGKALRRYSPEHRWAKKQR